MASGFCGESLMWWLEDGTLIIRGTGAMDDYDYDSNSRSVNSPWRNYRYEIERIIICDGVTSIGEWAFAYCEKLTKIRIPDSVTFIGDWVFWFCESLTKMKIPDGVTSIGDYTFSYCSSLTEIRIPDGITSIGDSAFSGCESLKEIKLPNGVKTIGESTFSGCMGLKEIKLPNGVKTIGESTFSRCIGLKEIKLPDSVTSVGEQAFRYCLSLTEIKLPDGVMFIGEQAFTYCNHLAEIKIPDSVIEIGEKVFDGCRRLKKIYCRRDTGFERKLREGNDAKIIYYDDKPKSAQIKPSPPKPARKPKPAPEKLRWKIEGKTLTVSGVRVIKDYSREHPPWLANLRDIQEIVIAEGVETISASAFIECTRLELLTIPASVKTIDDGAFTFCHCGDRSVNGGKNVLWSLDDGILTFKKNPAAKTDANFSLGAVSWRAVEKNVTGVKLERGIIPDKRFFDWLGGLGSDVPVSF